MHWLKARVPDPLLTIAAMTTVSAVWATGLAVAFWLFDEGGVLAVGGVLLGWGSPSGSLDGIGSGEPPVRLPLSARSGRREPRPSVRKWGTHTGATGSRNP